MLQGSTLPQATAKKIGIIGGGPGGLMAAYLLQRRAHFPFRITLYERCGRLGGKIVTSRFTSAPDAMFEAGAAEFYDYTQLGPDPLRELIAELELETMPMQSGGAIIGNRIIRSFDDVHREMGKATYQALVRFEQQARSLISPRDYYGSDWREDGHDPLSSESFHELVRRVPDGAARDYIRIMAHSDLACEPHQTSAGYGLQNYLMDEPDYMRLYSIVDGNERLTEELARGISAEVRLEEPVVRIEGISKNSYLVTSMRHGRMSTAEFDYVIVALPNDVIADITWAPETLADAMHKHHAFYDHPAHYLRVTALFERPFWRDIIGGSYFMSDAFGGCCLYDESARLPAGGKGVLSWLLAGEAALSMSNLDDASLAKHVLYSLPPVLQHGAALQRETAVQRWVGSVNALPAGFPAREPDSRHQPEPVRYPCFFVMGDYLFDSTINGVLDSADTVVEWIREEEEEEPKELARPAALAEPLPMMQQNAAAATGLAIASAANTPPGVDDRKVLMKVMP